MPDPSENAPATRSRSPVGLDVTRASIARVYDATLGGKDNYEVDRFVRDKVAEIAPRQRDVAWMNRQWLHRVVRYLTGSVGIDQFLDLGAGLPTVCNTHEIAQQHNPTAQVVYVDNDPLCTLHGRALLQSNEHTHFVSADLTRPQTLLAHPEIAAHLDPSRPLALILCGVLHHVDADVDPAGVMRRYIDAIPVGSYVAITHFWDPADGSAAHEMAVQLQHRFITSGLGSGWYRTRDEIASLFGDLDILAPGLVELDDWWPMGPALEPRCIEKRLLLGGVGRKTANSTVIPFPSWTKHT
ncbi:SAM-dependent methyltransferase [Nocardia sp. BSTN01]|uniref:SAM-dependent methyltransferase n=1 Tax=Nocardia sp. BSTN01 TaxID=2783665 RepID=UPI00188F641E|nr:SAM-dependent methyltransferase [Nocardia sp. BSTN01]MBF5000533.1 SAM-dependent methyltransferase [Nocardia sp. BSTN01]